MDIPKSTRIYEDALEYVTCLRRVTNEEPDEAAHMLIDKRDKYPDPNDWAEFSRVVEKLLGIKSIKYDNGEDVEA